MPGIDGAQEKEALTRLPFPSITKQHILNCSYPSWYARYKSCTLRSRIIPLTPPFLDYLREDGLWLPDDEPYEETEWSSLNADKAVDPAFEASSKPNDATAFADVHKQIQETIKELGGSVVPKLNWSAPKDALHMALSKNSIECRSPSDIYLLLKSSIFVSHDLDHAFDDTLDIGEAPLIPYSLILRPYFKINTAFEFRCFVRDRILVGITQRELIFKNYSPSLLAAIQNTIQDFFEEKLKYTFPDSCWTFDVYLPEPHDRVRLVDINPWAPRTDPLLFSWLELLTLQLPAPLLGPLSSTSDHAPPLTSSDEDSTDGYAHEDVEEIGYNSEFRVVNKDDPEAYNFATAPYSAHKMPKDVVDASAAGGSAMSDLMGQWEALMRGDIVEEEDSSDEDSTTEQLKEEEPAFVPPRVADDGGEEDDLDDDIDGGRCFRWSGD